MKLSQFPTTRKGSQQTSVSLFLCVSALMLCVFVTAQAQKTRVETVRLQSKLAGRALPYNAVLPPDYDKPEAKAVSYPVLYLLHGLTGHYSDWATKSKVAEYAAAYRVIVVTPEGDDGWYTDSATVATDKYESYILQELLPDVESRFRALKGRDGRAIAGLSMGGYGSLKFGVKHPELFVFAGSLSGALLAGSWTEKDFPPGARNPILDTIMAIYGPADSPTRAANDLFKLIAALTPEQIKALPFLYADCGTEDFLFAPNQNFAKLLVEKRIPHEYRERPGAHTWPYWDSQVQEILRLATARMSAPVNGK